MTVDFKYYKDASSGEVYAYEGDGSQDEYIRDGLVAMPPKEVQAHLKAQQGNTVLPTAVTMRQARLALLKLGLLAEVNEAIAAMPGDAGEAARIEWQFAGFVEKDSQLVGALSQALGWSSARLDELFNLAATL